MRRSKILFSAVAIASGLLIGLANPKEAKAATQDLSSGTYNVSTLDGNTRYNINGDVIFIIDQDKTLALSSEARIAMSEGDKLTIRKGEGNHKLTIGTTGTNDPLSTIGRPELTIESGNVEIKNDDAGSVFGGGTFNMRGGTLKTGAKGISAGTINISGGTVEAALGCGSWSSPTVNITGGTVKAVGGDYGIGEEIRSGNMYKKMTLNISGGNVYAEATGANHEFSDGRRFLVSGISVKALNITGGNLEAKVSHDDQVAIMSLNNITIDDVSIQSPEGGSSESYSITLGSYTFSGYTIKKDGAGAKHVVIGDGSPVTTRYQITVQADHGTASADRNEAEEGATINLSATPDDGYEFDKWTSGTQGVSFDDASSANTSFEMPARNVTVSANFIKKGSDPGDDKKDDKKDKKKDSGKHHKHKHSDDSSSDFVANPDAIVAFYIVNGAVDGKAKLGKQEQGPVCKSLFTASCPKGWIEAFSMSMSYDGVYTSTLKNGTLQLYIPAQYQKAGRQYAVMAMDKYGKVHIYQDTDALPFVFTSPLNFEGYAFCVIYKD